MYYALLNGQRVSAEEVSKNDKLTCPCCDTEVIPKQGHFKAWHFAHKSKNDCANWFKPMTEWHKNWQEQFPEHFREVVHKCPETGEKHIADIKTDTGVIIEFQHSPISVKEIESREKFYGEKMIWVLDGSKFKVEEDFHFISNLGDIKKRDEDLLRNYNMLDYVNSEREKYARYKNCIKYKTRSHFFKIAKKHVFIDTNDGNLIYLKFKKNDKIDINYRPAWNGIIIYGYDYKRMISYLETLNQEYIDNLIECFAEEGSCEFFWKSKIKNHITDKYINIPDGDVWDVNNKFFLINYSIFEHYNMLNSPYRCKLNAGVIIKKSDFIKKYSPK